MRNLLLELMLLFCCIAIQTILARQAVGQEKTEPSSVTASDRVEQTFRVVWGGPKARIYQGSILSLDGRIRIVRNLSVQPSALGCVIQNDSKSIEILPTNETTFGGVDIAVDGSMSSQLRLSFSDNSGETHFEQTVGLRDLQNSIWIQPLNESGNRIAIERQVDDKLRVEDERPSKIFECGEPWLLKVTGYHTGLPGGEYQLTANWAGRRSATAVATYPVRIDGSGSFATLDINLQIPSQEGAHRLELTLTQPSIVRSWTSQQKPLLSRSLELVAFDSDKEQATVSGWRPLLAIDTVAAVNAGNLSWLVSFANAPLSARGLEIPRFPSLADLSSQEQWQRLFSLSKSVTNNAPIQRSGSIGIREFPQFLESENSPRGQRCVTIEPGAYLALPLSELQPGHPHRLRIQVPSDRSTMLTVAIRDADNRDQVAISPQQTIYIPHAYEAEDQSSVQSEILFWPRTGSIQIVLSSGHRSRAASVGNILVESAELEIPKNNNKRSSDRQSDRQLVDRAARAVGIYIDQLFLADALAAPREKDPKTSRPLETWATWKATAERIVTHLQLSGANTLVLLAVGDAGSLFPMKSLPTVPWIDKSTFFSDGRSPGTYDFIELLLKHLERSGKRLIIELDLSSNDRMLPRKNFDQVGLYQERLLKSDTINANNTDPETQLRDPKQLGDYLLNPLHPSVQEAASAAIREVAQRYKASPALEGISLRLRPNSLTVFGGPEVGYNTQLLEQYSKERGFELPPDPNRRLELLSGSGKFDYLSWRAAQMTAFFAQLARIVRQNAPDMKFYLNTIRLWDGGSAESISDESQPVVQNPDQYLLGFGLDVEKLASIEGLVVTQGSVTSGWNSLASSQWLQTAIADSGATLPPAARQAALITHQPRAVELSRDTRRTTQAGSANSRAESNPANKPGNLSSATAPISKLYVDSIVTGNLARQSLLNQLLRADMQMIAFGGWYPVWTLEPKVAELVADYKQLPPVVFQEIGTGNSDAPIRIRQGTYNGKHYLMLLNASGIECELKLELSGNKPEAIRHLNPANEEFISVSDELITVKLPAGKLIAWNWEGTAPTIASVELTPNQIHVAELTRRLTRLEANLTRASDAGSHRILFHGSGTFEQWPDVVKPIGWNVSSLPDTLIQQAREFPHSGDSCVLLENNNSQPVSAWIQSTAIELPKTGRLALRAWLRSSAADHRSPLVKMGVIGRLKNGQRYEQSVYYGSRDNVSRPIANDWGRRPAELYLSAIPVDELIDLQVSIDLIGKGRVWIDDVEVVETWLHPDERNYVRGQLLIAKQKLADNNPFAAEKILCSQWALYLQELETESSQVQADRISPSLNSHEASNSWKQPKSTFQQLREAWLERWRR